MFDGHLLKTRAHIERIEKLYLEILYRCNFDCQHCFQGANLQRSDRFSLSEAKRAIAHFHHHFALGSVTICGGEPFLHPDLDAILAFAKARGLSTSVCSNGYRIGKILDRIGGDLDELRVSVDGVGETHDAMRRPGSFQACLETLAHAEHLGIRTSITTTVTDANALDIERLAKTVAAYGVTHIKIHQLRPVGNALAHPSLRVAADRERQLATEIRRATAVVPILLDEDASPAAASEGTVNETELERIEIQPDGRLYVSCKAVGENSNAFWYDKGTDCVRFDPNQDDELSSCVPQVRYMEA